MSNQAKLIERIKALLAKAKSTTNEHEADAFMTKAMEMMQQHQIGLHQLDDASDPVASRPGFSQREGNHVWLRNLYVALARLYGCRTWHNPIRKFDAKTNKGYWEEGIQVIGRESAQITLDLMHPFVVQQVREQAKLLAPVTGMSVQGQAKRIGAALEQRIWRLIREQEKDDTPRTDAVAKNALITKDQVVALYEQETAGFDTGRAARRVTDGLARAAAGKVSLARQVDGAGTLRIGSK